MARARPSGAARELLDPAWQMRWRVPELCLMLSDRAVAEARRTGDRVLRLRAEALALFAINRLGRGVTATARAIAAVLEAETAGEDVAAELRVELATCARWAGSHEVALRVLHPVLELERIEPMVRAHAMLELAASLSLRRDGTESADALDEAERLYVSVTESDRDTGRLLRARVCTARACHHRRNGEFAAALEATVQGLDLVRRLGDPAADSGEVRARLVLEQVHSLLDLGRREEALEAAEWVLHQPVRAAAAGPSGWLRFALATRVHLTDGGYGAVVMLLNDAVAHAERHKLDGLLAEALSTLSYVHERGAEFPQALRCLRSSYAADRRWRAAVQTARVRLLEELPALAGHITDPPQRSREAGSPSPIANPDPATGATAPASGVGPRWRPGGENTRDAARQLMDTLAQRAGSTGGDSVLPATPALRSSAGGAASAGSQPTAGTSGPTAGSRSPEGPETNVADWTEMLPRLNEPQESTGRGLPSTATIDDSDDEGFPLYDYSPAGGREDHTSSTQDFPAVEEETSPVRPASWHAGGDTPATVTAARQSVDLVGNPAGTSAIPTRQGELAPRPESTADAERDSMLWAAARRPRNGSVPTEGPADDAQARVKSLAEIRASLQRITERSRQQPAAAPEDATRATSRQAETSRPVTEIEGQGRTRHGESPPDSSAEDDGMAREEIGLADLLAEALVAYETARRSDQRERGGKAAGFGPVLPEPTPAMRDPERRGTERGGTERGGTERGGTERGGTERGGTERGDTGRGDTGRGDTGRGDTGRGDVERGDTEAKNTNAPRARHRRASREPDSGGGPQPWTFDRY